MYSNTVEVYLYQYVKRKLDKRKRKINYLQTEHDLNSPFSSVRRTRTRNPLSFNRKREFITWGVIIRKLQLGVSPVVTTWVSVDLPVTKTVQRN